MQNIKLNKAYLSLEQRNLKNYQRFLPSLELKRKKLLAERMINEGKLRQLKDELRQTGEKIQYHLPMASCSLAFLKALIKVERIERHEENLVGVTLPVFNGVYFTVAQYAYFNTPHWFDALVQFACEWIEAEVHLEVMHRRFELLNKAIQTVTQRKNLFEKVLIPNALNNIRRIQIFLSDTDRAAVVGSKIAKKKRQLL